MLFRLVRFGWIWDRVCPSQLARCWSQAFRSFLDVPIADAEFWKSIGISRRGNEYAIKLGAFWNPFQARVLGYIAGRSLEGSEIHQSSFYFGDTCRDGPCGATNWVSTTARLVVARDFDAWNAAQSVCAHLHRVSGDLASFRDFDGSPQRSGHDFALLCVVSLVVPHSASGASIGSFHARATNGAIGVFDVFGVS